MTVTVGGPPAGARVVQRVCVLRGTNAQDWTPRFPGKRLQLGTRVDDRGTVKQVKPHTLWVNRAARLAQALTLEARADDRTVVVFELPSAALVRGFWACVYDGRGRLVEDLADGPTNEATARALARSECWRLREDAELEPWRWEVQPWPKRQQQRAA